MSNSNTWNHLTLCKQIIKIKLNFLCLIAILEIILTVWKQMGSKISFKNKLNYKIFAYNIYIYIYICVCVCAWTEFDFK